MKRIGGGTVGRVDLDEVADELYAVHPDEFIALRKEHQDRARGEGDRELAKDIGGLPKPSTAAWVSNLLVREHRAEIEGLVDLGGLLREAQENLAGDQLRALNSQRSRLLGALTYQALTVAREHGHPVSTSVESQIEDTLRAAMSDPEAGAALLSGRLTSAMTYSGLGTIGVRPDLRLVRTPKAERATAPARATRSDPAGTRRRESDRRREEERRQAAERRAAAERRRRELTEARQAAAEATAAAREAAEDAAAEQAQVRELVARQQELTARLEQLRADLVRAEHAVADAAAEVRRAERRQRNAQRAAEEAAAARDRALARVEELARRVE
jgi:hypothetical protein